MAITNPHDRFFKQVFTKKENAADLIRAFLPEEIRSKLALDALKLEKGSYVDDRLKEYFSDLVYNCSYQGKCEIKISILLEHKSYVVEYPHLQILRYLLMVWETQFKQKQPLTVVIPILIYHGQDQWHYRRLSEYFIATDPVFERFIPSFDYIFQDLSRYSDQEIKTRIFDQVAVAIAIGVMKNISRPEKLIKALQELSILGEFYLEQPEGLRFLETVVRYLFYATDLNEETVIKTIQKISEKGSKLAMTIAERLKAEGLKEGILVGKREGILEGKKEGVREGILEGKKEGVREGILEGIELAVELKWGAAGLNLFEKKIKSIPSLEKLQEIKEAIRVARDINELEKIL